MKSYGFFLSFALIFGASFVLSLGAQSNRALAQDAGAVAPSAQGAIPSVSGLEGLVPEGPKAKVKMKGQNNSGPVYLQMTYPNLFRLAWVSGVYDLDDPDALDNYLKISECTLYKKYFKNEFEWEKIRKAARSYLDTHGRNVSKYYEYSQPLYLGRYDNQLQGFPLENADHFLSLKTLQIANFKVGQTDCGQLSVDAYKYPSAAVVNIISPLSLTFIRVPKDLAQHYIEWRSQRGLANGDSRQAYIKYRVRVDRFVKIDKINGSLSYVFEGRLMQIDVFADEEMMMPLYNQLF